MASIKVFTQVPDIFDPFDFSKFIPIVSTRVNPAQDSIKSDFFEKFLTMVPEAGVIRITQATEHSIDAISKLVYGTEDLWWFICLYNGIEEPYFIPSGTELKLFSRVGLELLLGQVRSVEIPLSSEETLRQKPDMLSGISLLYFFFLAESTFIRSTPQQTVAIIVFDDVYGGHWTKDGELKITGDSIQVFDDFEADEDESDFLQQFATEAPDGSFSLKTFGSPVIGFEGDGIYLNVLVSSGISCADAVFEPVVKFAINEKKFPSLPLSMYFRGDLITARSVELNSFALLHPPIGTGFTSSPNFIGLSLDGVSYTMASIINVGETPRTYIRTILTTNHNPENEVC